MSVLPRHRNGVTALLMACALSAAAPAAGLTAAVASADEIGDKRAEAGALADKLLDQARRIVALDVDLRQAHDRLADAEASVAQAEIDLAATSKRQDDIKRRLVVQAQDAYVVGGSVSVLKYLIRTNAGDEIARRAYLRIVTGQDRHLIGQLRASKEDLSDLRSRLDAARRRARSEASGLAEDRTALDRAIRAQRAVLQQVNGELASLVAAEQARRDAKAREEAAARDVAAREAARRAQAAGAPVGAAPAAAAPATTAAAEPRLLAPLGDSFACVRQLESGNNYASPGGGAYQFQDATWQSLGYSGTASNAPPSVQDQAARELQARDGWAPWAVAPLCGLL
jgi:septal ring factor EnvC (AmiA/AmiB activator)